MNTFFLEVNGAPFQTQQLPSPCAGQKKQMRQHFPFQRLPSERVADRRDLLRLEVVHFLLDHLRKRGFRCDVERDLPFLPRWVESRRNQPVVFQNGLCRQTGTSALILPRLAERRIKAVQMVCPQVLQLDMTDSRVYTLGQFLIADNRGVLRSALFLHSNYIFAVRRKFLAAVSGNARSAFLFKGRGVSLGLFSRAFFRPAWGNIECRRPRLELLSLRVTPPVDTDGIRDQFAILIASLLNVSHYCPLLSFFDMPLPCPAFCL